MKALLIIDMINDFVEEKGALFVEGAKNLIPNINEKIKKFREEGGLIIFVCDAHSEDDKEFEVWGKHAVKGTWGSEIAGGMDYREGDIRVDKTRFSAFFKTNLEDILKEHGIEKVYLTGILTDICVLYTAGDAYMRGFKVAVFKDCVKSVSEERHEWALKHMKEVLGAEII